MDLGSRDGGARGVVFLFTLSDVTHPGSFGESDGDCEDKVSGISCAKRGGQPT